MKIMQLLVATIILYMQKGVSAVVVLIVISFCLHAFFPCRDWMTTIQQIIEKVSVTGVVPN